MDAKISVIIAVYKCEKYIEKCARSLFEQTLNEIEYIFVNDATPDSSINILNIVINEYPRRKPFIKIINLNSNGGVSNARRIGIAHATGEYIIHTDSDDWVDRDIYERLYQKAKETNADIVGCNFRHEFIDMQYDFHQDYADDMEDNIRHLINGKIFPSLCTSLTRKSLITDNGISFPIGLNMGEDLFFNLHLYLHTKRIASMDWAPYHYRHTEDSSCFQRTSDSVDSDIQIAGMIERLMRGKGLYNTFSIEIEYRKIYSKMPLIINFDNYENYKKWISIYPETHKMIMDFKQFNLYLRIELWFAAHKLFYVSKAMRHTIILLHNIKSIITY